MIYNDGIHYTKLIEITPSNSTELELKAYKVTDETDGNVVAVQTESMAAAVTDYCILGAVYPVGGRKIKIMSTGTTATTIIGYV